MAKYRKKPVVVEAYHFTRNNFKRDKQPIWLKEAIGKDAVSLWSQYGGNSIGGEIETLEGNYEISENDWIIKGVKGELYPCKPDIFEQTYDLVD